MDKRLCQRSFLDNSISVLESEEMTEGFMSHVHLVSLMIPLYDEIL